MASNDIRGTDGPDIIVGTEGAERIRGEDGNDRLSGRGGNDRLDGDDGDDRLEGGTGDDDLNGGNGRDLLLGGLGNDDLTGNDGNDTLVGGAGNDKLEGELGKDVLTGGDGRDRFEFDSILHSRPGANRDVITDFTRGQDLLVVDDIDANSVLAGNQAFRFIGGAAFSGDGGEVRFANGIVSGDTDGDGLADFQIQLLNVTTLQSTDFDL